MSLLTKPTSVTGVLVAARVVNRLGGAGMAFLGVRMTRDLGMPLEATTLVLAAFGLATIPSRVLGGVLTTRWGPRPALVAGLAAAGVAQAVVAAGSTVAVVVAGVVLLGLAYEVIEPATQTAVVAGVDPARRASRFSLLWASLSVAGVLAGVLAAFVTQWGVGALFAVDAATSLAAAALVALLLPRLPVHRVHRAWRAALRPRVLGWSALCTVSATVVMVVVLLLPVVVDRAGHPPTLTAWLLVAGAASALGTQRLLARVEARAPTHHVLAAGFLLFAGALALWSVGGVRALVAGAVLEGAAGCLVVGPQMAVASRLAVPGSEAAVMTVQGLSWGVASVLAPLVGGALLGEGERTLWLACAAVAVVLATGHASWPARPDLSRSSSARPSAGTRGVVRSGRGSRG
ncbi:MFS transporter [Phycicoccus sonneratiae]|uniref:MFS transporter n=1 Tax=Phycicoccus sonneratiae TaxID=2807628 RepID=A0ABS2CLK5_9MICO|nr:MFS transporter [Phycicoccus sonneraticus]MBM6400775.1 MFS transporter [Phycicoccus sonneraticus]